MKEFIVNDSKELYNACMYSGTKKIVLNRNLNLSEEYIQSLKYMDGELYGNGFKLYFKESVWGFKLINLDLLKELLYLFL
ncbi:MAG: hypothetical protein ACRC41_18440 [Sarcina sp.]